MAPVFISVIFSNSLMANSIHENIARIYIYNASQNNLNKIIAQPN
jgi:hypothetical protein